MIVEPEHNPQPKYPRYGVMFPDGSVYAPFNGRTALRRCQEQIQGREDIFVVAQHAYGELWLEFDPPIPLEAS